MFSASKSAAPATAGGYQVSNSLRFRSSASAYLNRTPSVAGNRTTWTLSFWMKIGTNTNNVSLLCNLNASAQFGFGLDLNPAANPGSINIYDATTTYVWQLNTTQVFRDPSAWYHIVVAVDTTQATASNRVKLYVNGSQVTAFSTANYPSQNYQALWNTTAPASVAKAGLYPGGYFDGYMADINFIDGQALTPSSFGAFDATSGVWQPTKYSGAYGTNGFYLKFSDTTSTTTLCYDYSGNSNNWTPNNISLTAGSTYDSMLDSPTNYDNGGNGVGNYCVMNAVSIGSDCTLSDGNLGVAYGSSGTIKSTMATIGMSSGKWYCEFSITGGSSPSPSIGISSKASSSDMPEYIGYTANGWGYYIDGTKRNNAVGGGVSAYGATWTTGDIIGIAFDADAGSLTFYKNGTSQGVAFTGLTSGPYYFGVGDGGGIPTFTSWFNFGQRPFAYTPPSGFKSLCTYNLPTPTIQNGAGYMAATLYTGNGSTQSISNSVNSASFQPDLVWIKSRSAATDNKLTDSVRGVTKGLISNSTAAETTDTTGLTAFGAAGFTLGANTTYNNSGATYVGWQWKAGGTAVTNTAGSITSQVSANTTAGFSVVTYTGTGVANSTVGHGLNVTPGMIIVKQRNGSTYAWNSWHTSLSSGYYIQLNSTGAQDNSVAVFPANTVTSSVFNNGGTGATIYNNASGGTYVAYCFAAIAGYSAFGSYTGNGSSDGPFVYCGFRPRYVLIKRTDAAEAWVIEDSSRDPYNVNTRYLLANSSDAEGTTTLTDFLSNGFKFRSASQNIYGATFIYAAFAENPFNYSLAR